MCQTVEANYQAPVRVGAWWSAAKLRQRERARKRMGYEPPLNDPVFEGEEEELSPEFDTLEEMEIPE
jgi:hypothetical protein